MTIDQTLQQFIERKRKANAASRTMAETRAFALLSEDQLADALLARARDFDELLDFLEEFAKQQANILEEHARLQSLIDAQSITTSPPQPKPRPSHLRPVDDDDPDVS